MNFTVWSSICRRHRRESHRERENLPIYMPRRYTRDFRLFPLSSRNQLLRDFYQFAPILETSLLVDKIAD